MEDTRGPVIVASIRLGIGKGACLMLQLVDTQPGNCSRKEDKGGPCEYGRGAHYLRPLRA